MTILKASLYQAENPVQPYHDLQEEFFHERPCISMKIDHTNRPAAAKIYTDYWNPFLRAIPGALTKNLLIRDADVQVLHGFDSVEHAEAYLQQ